MMGVMSLAVGLGFGGGCTRSRYPDLGAVSEYAIVNNYLKTAQINCYQYSREKKGAFSINQALITHKYSRHRYAYSVIDGRQLECEDCPKCYNNSKGYDLKIFVHDSEQNKHYLAFNKMVMRHELLAPDSKNTPALLKIWIKGSTRNRFDQIYYRFENTAFTATTRRPDVSLMGD